jgi:hypothetical protein
MSRPFRSLAFAPLLLIPFCAGAATYTVGPSGRQYTQLTDLFRSRDLAPGDVVLVDGSATYNGNIVVGDDDSGSSANPVTIRWSRTAGTTRPVLSGGTNTIKFEQSNNVVLEGFDVRGGGNACIFSEADNVTVRDSVIHDCPGQGILGADNNSGSFTLEYNEIYNAGSGTNRHVIYMQSDEVAFPNAVFRMRYNYVHNGNGGNLLKSRHQRNEIYYNWLEGAAYQELELIGPDCNTQQGGWSTALKREDSDVVGNVIVHTSSWRNAIRAGGDLDGLSQGRVRLVDNTVLFDRAGAATMVLVQLGLESIEMHNNVLYQNASGSAPAVLAENPASDVDTPACSPFLREPWSSGRKVAGGNNWFQTSATSVPGELVATLRGSNPQLTDIARRDLRPLAASALVDAGNRSPAAPAAFPFPNPLTIPVYEPPSHAKLAIGAQKARTVQGASIDIGAFEQTGASAAPVPMNDAHPLIPPKVRTLVPASGAKPEAAASRTVPAASLDAATPVADVARRDEDHAFRLLPPWWWMVAVYAYLQRNGWL